MLQTLLVSLLIIAICVGLLAIRLFFGKPFVHTHIDGNEALRKKGIHCAQSYDAEMRAPRRHAVRERPHTSTHETTHKKS
jgi:hypothetical protein